MKRILPLILTLLLLLSACGGEEPTESTPEIQEPQPSANHSANETKPVSDSDTVTLYCLVKEEVFNEDFLKKYNTYEYDDNGNLTRQETFLSSSKSVWNEEYEVYVYELIPIDDLVDRVYSFAYDRAGNITEAQYEEYEDGELTSDHTHYYSYSFNELGEIKQCEFHTTWPLVSPLNYYFTYQDGRIVNVDVYKSMDGESYGDRVQTFQFEYDNLGNLFQEKILFCGSYQGEFISQYNYDDKGLVSSIVCRGSDDEGEYYRAQKFYHYDGSGSILAYTEEDGEPTEYAYMDHLGQFFFPFSPDPGVVINEQDNVIVIQDMEKGARYEYTYQAIEVSRADAERYYRRWHMINSYPVDWDTDSDFYYPVFFYHLIPNPIW